MAGTVFVVGRLLVAAHGNPSVFIVVGSQQVTGSSVPRDITVIRGSGYDGAFYYRMALDPVDLARTAFGIRIDTVSRFERIGYPAIAWLIAAGQRSLVPATLIITNVVALGAIGFGGGLLARDSDRHAMWGLVLAGFWGYLWSAARDLTEITAAAFLVLGLYAYRRNRSLLAALLLLGAVLAKETALYVVLVIAATRIVRWLARRDLRSLGLTDVTWALPLIGFAGWQVAVLWATGRLPLSASGQANLSQPFTGLGDGLRHYLSHPLHVASLLWIGELTVLFVIVIAASASIRSSSVPRHERLAWAAFVLLTICLSPSIWRGDVGFRSIDDIYLFSWIVLLGTHRRLWPLAAILGGTWCVVAIELIKFV
jgi:FtsH-binding integral membrane protein